MHKSGNIVVSKAPPLRNRQHAGTNEAERGTSTGRVSVFQRSPVTPKASTVSKTPTTDDTIREHSHDRRSFSHETAVQICNTINEGDEAGGGCNRSDIMQATQEIRAVGAHVQKECREAIRDGLRDMGSSLRDEMRRELNRVEQAIRSSGPRPGAVDRVHDRVQTLGEDKQISAVEAAYAASLRQAAQTTYRAKTGKPVDIPDAQVALMEKKLSWKADVKLSSQRENHRDLDRAVEQHPDGVWTKPWGSEIEKPTNDYTVVKPKDAPPMLPCEIPGAIEEVPFALTYTGASTAVTQAPTSAWGQERSLASADGLEHTSTFDPTASIDYATGLPKMKKPTKLQMVKERHSAGWDITAQLREQQKEDLEALDGNKRNMLDISREKARLESNKKKSFSFRELLSVEELIKTPMFDNFVGFIILVNAAVIGFQTDYNAKELTENVPIPYFVFEQVFGVWFTVELVLRIWVFRCKFWKPGVEGWLWNYFDSLVVGAQLLEVFVEIVLRSASVDAKSLRVLRILRILRLVRILRVVRVLHLISELRAIVSSIIGSFRSLIWVVVLLLLMIYIVAVFFTQSVTDHLILLKEQGNQFTNEDETLGLYFGSMGRAVLSLWQAMSGGLDWDTLANPLFTKVSFLTGMAFACFVAFALLALMNVVTGVFVQTALLSARTEEDNFMTSQILALFHMADKDKSATISWDEIVESLDDPGTAKEWKSVGVQAEDARYLFRLLDMEDTGEVSFEEFLGGCLRLSGAAKAIDVLTVMQEARKNEEKMVREFLAVTSALIEINDNVKQNQENAHRLMADMGHMNIGINNCGDDVVRLTNTIDSELSVIKSMLSPVKVMEDLFVTSNPQHTLV